jgi:NhaA family Na+:H+ antiporter
VKPRTDFIREFSIPLLAGVGAALAWANLDYAGYMRFKGSPLLGPLSFDFITNEIFMVFFFGIAAVEITVACLPGGALNPPRKAVNPLFATVGGVAGPALLYLALNAWTGAPELARGWGIPMATDIALAWLTARLIFGAQHAVVSFLLLLAIADDAIGLVVIAAFYPDPTHPVAPAWLAVTAAGMLLAFALRRMQAGSYWPYLLLAGGVSWTGLFLAHLHPALALVFIVPFMPAGPKPAGEGSAGPSTLTRFEHEWKVVVDFGLLLFGLCNAGVPFSGSGTVTWLVLASLIAGKTAGIALLGWLAARAGFPLPTGMGAGHLAAAGMIAGIGFTVAIFVSGAAFTDPALEGAAKMGAMLSVIAAPMAWGMAKAMKLR